MGVILAWLAWRMVALGGADLLAESRPQLALRLDPNNAAAGIAWAYERLGARRANESVRLSLAVLEHEPANVAAQRTLGLAYDALGRKDLADRSMDFAGRRSWRDSPTHSWLLRRRLEQGRAGAAIDEADSLLRRAGSGPARDRLMAFMIVAADTPATARAVVSRLTLRPGWRRDYLRLLGGATGRTQGAERIFSGLASAKSTIAPDEYTPLVERLVRERRWIDAAAAWKKYAHAPGADAALHDGDFARAPDGTAFTWLTPSTAGAQVEVANSELHVDWDGFSPFDPPRQLLVLTPGAYRLAGEIRGDGAADRLPRWRVRCADGDQVLSTGPEPTGAWTAFQTSFVVPPTGCTAQWIALDAEPGERRTDLAAETRRLRLGALH